MRDALDPGTIEMPLQRKRGRPAIHSGGAMSAAERARRYREGLKLESRQVVPTIVLEADGEPLRDAALLDALRTAVASGNGLAVHEITGLLRQRYPKM